QAVKPKESAAVKPQMAQPPEKTVEEAKIPVEKIKEKVFETRAASKPPLQQADVGPPLPEKKPMVQQAGTTPKLIREEATKKLTYSYDPKGKPDPFRPIFAPEREGMAPAKKKGKKKKRLPLTPLQKVDLTHLNLVGIIILPTGNKALVADPSGKGYVITKGTYVGTNFGQVKQIIKDRVIVEEEVEDFTSGEMKPQTRELRLQKRPGQV
ncbi:MAG: pilus assembly protein PilP, partial [Deltaproteobacteria bacterium]|nr:pilus assembly protein PilP [Deltaproteobacteria bacterium]